MTKQPAEGNLALPMHPRMKRENRTIELMIGIYCRENHDAPGGLCGDCRELLDYARLRLKKCPFQERKTTCGNCAVHCYKPAMRGKVKDVMRYAGPRMARKHPLLALGHLLDGLRKAPKPMKRKGRNP